MKKTLMVAVLLLLSTVSFGCSSGANHTNGDTQPREEPQQTETKEATVHQIEELVSEFGSKLQNVSLQAPKDIVSKSLEENYSKFVNKALLDEWLNDPLDAPGRLVSSPWPDRIEIDNIEKITESSYEVKGSIIEMTSENVADGRFAAKRPVTLTVKKGDTTWLIDSLSMGDYMESPSSDRTGNSNLSQDDYALVVGDQTIQLRSWDIEVNLAEILGKPISEKIDILGSESDTYSGSYVKTLEYDGLTIELFSPKDNGKQFWIMSIVSTKTDFHTPMGIRVGSTVSDLKNAYKNIEVALDGRKDPNNCAYLLSSSDEVKNTKFEVENGMVKEIKLYVELP